MIRSAAPIVVVVLALAVAACTPHIGITITNAPSIPDCHPGNSPTPCR